VYIRELRLGAHVMVAVSLDICILAKNFEFEFVGDNPAIYESIIV
jgi:hypothetical protein